MDPTEDKKIEKFGKRRMHCTCITLLRYDIEKICISCGYKGL